MLFRSFPSCITFRIRVAIPESDPVFHVQMAARVIKGTFGLHGVPLWPVWRFRWANGASTLTMVISLFLGSTSTFLSSIWATGVQTVALHKLSSHRCVFFVKASFLRHVFLQLSTSYPGPQIIALQAHQYKIATFRFRLIDLSSNV